MHILIVGGAGYIGSHTAKIAARHGHVPVVFDNLEKGHRWAVQWGPFVEGDLGDPSQVREALAKYPIEAVIHFASYILVGESMQAPGKYFENNFSKTLNLLEAMREHGVKRVVFSSTAAVYGTPERLPIPEDHPARPVNPYGESKLMVERMLRWYGVAHGFQPVSLRYFNAAGADPDGEIGEGHDPETHLIPLAVLAALGHRPELRLFGTDYPTPDGTALRDYVHVTDLAEAHLLALGHPLAEGSAEAFNLGTGQGYSVREVIQMVERIGRRPIAVTESPRRPGDAPVLVADATRARQALGWKPRLSALETIVETAWRWHRSWALRAGSGEPHLVS